MPGYLSIRRDLWDRLLSDVRARIPEEACGLLAGSGEQVQEVISVENIYHSPYRYRMDPEGQLSAFQYIEKQGLELLAIYHSHPGGPAHPSSTDIKEAYYPDAVYVIVSPDNGSYIARGFIINKGDVLEIPIRIET